MTDELLNIENKEYTLDGLKPGESAEIALGEYTVTQEDIDKQQPIKNVVTAENGDGPSETTTPVKPYSKEKTKQDSEQEDKIAPSLPYTGLSITIGLTLIGIIISLIGVTIYKKRK